MNDFNFKFLYREKTPLRQVTVYEAKLSHGSIIQLEHIEPVFGRVNMCMVFIPDAPKSRITRLVELIKTIYAHITDR